MARPLTQYRLPYGLFAALYLLFLIVPWVLTCYQARRPFLLTKLWNRPAYDLEAHGIRQIDADLATRFADALEVLSYLAPLIALPAIYKILSRAVVVYTLRTGKSKQLNARQLFSLADRKFIWGLVNPRVRTWFSFFAVLLILVTVTHAILRAATVDTTWNRYALARTEKNRYGEDDSLDTPLKTPNGWTVEQIGLTPTPDAIQTLPVYNVLTRLRQEIIGTHPVDWQRKAWLVPSRPPSEDPRYFVSTIQKDTTTGMIRNLALRMDSEFSCFKPYRDTDFPTEDCPGGENYPYWQPELRLNICVQGNGTGIVDGGHVSPWANTTDKQRITEHLFIRMPDTEFLDVFNDETVSQHGWWNWEGDFQCTVHTDLAYFVLGNDDNNQTFSRKLERLSDSDANIVMMAKKYVTPYRDWRDEAMYNDRGSYLYGEEASDVASPVPGPLTLAARALFGKGSFYDMSQRVSPDNPERANFSAMLAGSCPYPFQRHPKVQYACHRQSFEDPAHSRWASYGVVDLLKRLDPGSSMANDGYPLAGPGWDVLDSALYLANQAVLDLAIAKIDSADFPIPPMGGIFIAKGIAVRQFVISDRAMAAVSALLAAQVVGILAFIAYSYQLPTWTSTLDALAIARIAQQLKDDHLLRTIGLRRMARQEKKRLMEMDGVIGLVEPIPLEDLSSTAANTTTARPSSVSQPDAHIHNGQTAGVPVVTDDPRMGMSSIPIDVQTVVSNDLDNHENNNNQNNSNTHAINNNIADNEDNVSDSNHGTQTHGGRLERPLPQLPLVESSAPRLSLNATRRAHEPDNENDNDNDNHPGGTISSPPAYTPRRETEPPTYATALGVAELRVGGQGLVTRKNIPRRRENVWV